MTVAKIERWLRSAIMAEDAASVRLQRAKKRGHDDLQLFVWDSEVDLDELANEIWATAEDEGTALGGTAHRFQLKAYDEANKELCFMTFRIAQRGMGGGGLAVDGAADFEGEHHPLVGQLMRHNEQLMRTTVGSMQMLLKSFGEQTEMLSEQLGEANTARADMARQLHETHDQRLLLLAETKKTEADAEAKLELTRQFAKVAPALTSHFLRKVGIDIDGGIPGPVVEAFESLNPDQLLAIVDALTPEQALVMGEFLTDLQEKKEIRDRAEREKTAEKAPETKH